MEDVGMNRDLPVKGDLVGKRMTSDNSKDEEE